MKAWLSGYNADLFFAPDSPEELARYELSVALPHTGCRIKTNPALGEGYHILRESDGSYTVSGGRTGVLYGAYALIRLVLSGASLPEFLSSSPPMGLLNAGIPVEACSLKAVAWNTILPVCVNLHVCWLLSA